MMQDQDVIRTESRRENGIDYEFHHQRDGNVMVYEYNDGLPLKRICGPVSLDIAEETIVFREVLNFPAQRLC